MNTVFRDKKLIAMICAGTFSGITSALLNAQRGITEETGVTPFVDGAIMGTIGGASGVLFRFYPVHSFIGASIFKSATYIALASNIFD